jgi:K(+)-stimulated pyrophosphate-energized sodium pump
MAELPRRSQNTDKLDAVGKHHRGDRQGLCHRTAALTALALFTAFGEEVAKNPNSPAAPGRPLVFNLTEPGVIIGIFLGAACRSSSALSPWRRSARPRSK